MEKVNITLIASPERNRLTLVKEICISSDKAKEYGYIKPKETENKVTVLDAMIVANEELYSNFKDMPKVYFDVAETDFISKIFGVETFYAGFRINNELPWDENGNGLTANKAVLNENDVLNLFIVHDRNYSDIFLNFENSESIFEKGSEIKIRLLGERHLYSGKGKKPLKDFTISVLKDSFDIRQIKNYITDEDGCVYFKIYIPGEYHLTVTDGADYFIAPYKKIIIKERPQN